MTRLTPSELQEMNRFLEAGKPLPDKYRFLLFDDKREVELVWNGKTNEVTNGLQTKVKYDFVYVDQEGFEKYKPDTLKELVSGFREYK